MALCSPPASLSPGSCIHGDAGPKHPRRWQMRRCETCCIAHFLRICARWEYFLRSREKESYVVHCAQLGPLVQVDLMVHEPKPHEARDSRRRPALDETTKLTHTGQR